MATNQRTDTQQSGLRSTKGVEKWRETDTWSAVPDISRRPTHTLAPPRRVSTRPSLPGWSTGGGHGRSMAACAEAFSIGPTPTRDRHARGRGHKQHMADMETRSAPSPSVPPPAPVSVGRTSFTPTPCAPATAVAVPAKKKCQAASHGRRVAVISDSMATPLGGVPTAPSSVSDTAKAALRGAWTSGLAAPAAGAPLFGRPPWAARVREGGCS